MTVDNQAGFFDERPIELTSTQRRVVEILRTSKSKKYSLADWYLGAIYAAKNTYNPDRLSQAAQSLRELLEKLPRVFVESEIQETRPNFREMRVDLYSRLCSDKNRYEEEMKGKIIDPELDETICNLYSYLELNQTPSRSEQIHSMLNKLDPMHDTLDQGIIFEKSKRFRKLWKTFEGLAHHNTNVDEEFLWEQIALAEQLIIDLLAPITTQDQRTIRTILGKEKSEKSDVTKILELIKRRGANYAYFFKTVDNPIWIVPLVENGFFNSPPCVEAAGDGRISFPLWWPIFYLHRISEQEPEKVVEIILNLEKTDNPRILREIFSIACDIQDNSLSLRLKPLIIQFLKSPYRWGEEELIIKILKKWGGCQGPTRNAAYEIIKYVIAFQPDPKEEEKRSRRKENSEAWNTTLEPTPRFQKWEYQQILEKGVRPLAEIEPYQVARILIDAVAGMIRLTMHKEEIDRGRDEDLSELWCRRLDKLDHDYQDVKENLVQTLTNACEQVYESTSESIEALDQALRNYHWKLFRRLRQHLYALYPNEQTLPWIREQILEYEDYSKWKYNYEFQLMIRKASEHFGYSLLSKDKLKDIIDTILSGPPKEDYRKEGFQQYKRYFHRVQLRPFVSLLDGDVRRYYDELENEAIGEPVTDDSYSPYSGVISGSVSFRSPKSVEELEALTDEEILTYLNEWDDEHRDKDDWFVEINISALAGAFQSLFKEKIVQDDERLSFWMANRDRIERPIYVTAMLKAIIELVSEKNFDNLEQWIEFSAWVLSHPDSAREEDQPEPREESRDYPDWGSSRRAVVDFVDECVKKDSNIPITVRNGIAGLLMQVCCQFDWRLDNDHPVLLNRDDPITEAINNTRSRALESLINFGFWVRRHLPEDEVSEVTEILTKRIAVDAEIPLTRPEQALLGMHFGQLCALNRDWATQQKEILFPQENETVWRDTFGNYIRFNGPAKLTFEILRDDFMYALDHLNILTSEKEDGKELVDRLGQHLFAYYLWELYPLTGEESLLERFYEKTNYYRSHWAQLFDHIGRSLKNSGKHLDRSLIERIVAFFDWRIGVAEPIELQEFTFWLEAECLDPEWRLQSYSKILEFKGIKDMGLFMQVRYLNKLLPDNLKLVLDCFAKITDAIDPDSQMYLSPKEAKPILEAGLNAKDTQIRENALHAQENLLKLCQFDYLDIG